MTATRPTPRIAWSTHTLVAPRWRDAPRHAALALLFWAASALPAAAAYVDTWGLSPGTPAPAIGARDQDGNEQTLATLAGRNGLLLVFGRSVDWCPFCKRQVIELAAFNDRFVALGVRVAVITIDRQRKLKAFHSAQSLPFPLLHEEGARHVRAFKVRNIVFGPRDPSYGLPYPGLVYIDAGGIIRARFAVEGYRTHPQPQTVLDAIAKLVPAGGADASDADSATRAAVPARLPPDTGSAGGLSSRPVVLPAAVEATGSPRVR